MTQEDPKRPIPLKVSEWPPLERFERAAGIAGIGHYVWDVVADRCLLCSDEHAAIHGMERDEYIAQSSTLNGVAHPDDLNIVREAFFRLRAGERFEVEYRLVTPAGETRYVREIGHPVFDDTGRVVQEMGTTQDITHQKLVELELLRAREILSEGVESLPLGFALFDKDGRLQVHNETYRTMLPMSGHLVKPGVHIEDILRNSADTSSKLFGYDDAEAYVQDRLAATKTGERSWTYQQTNGRWIKLDVQLTDSGGFVSVMEDVTEAKQREEQLLQSQKMEAVGQLTGGIAHDFNNLLAVILGNAELLEELDPEFKPMAQDIVKAAQRGAELTKSLLAFSRRQVLSAQSINLIDLMAEFVPMIDRTLGEEILLRFGYEADLWPAFVDRAHLENAVLNLALNARDAMPKGGELVIQCRNADHRSGPFPNDVNLKPGAFVVIEVSDTGVGMSAEQIAHAFEPFYTTKGVGQGTGLGLSSVIGFAEQSGGTARIAKTSESGTGVEIWLPRSEGKAARKVDASRGAAQPGRGESILVIEDDIGLQELAGRVLRDAGYLPIGVSDVNTAREVCQSKPEFDLILSDIVLPGGFSGPDFAKEMAEQGSTVPFVFMTGYAPGGMREDAREASGKVLRKPFSKTDLLAEIRARLSA